MTADSALGGTTVVCLTVSSPLPFATMLLGDLGADVIRIDRVGAPLSSRA